MKHVLREYMQKYDISAKELSDRSAISKSTLSRYLSGSRTPDSDGPQTAELAAGLEACIKDKQPEAAVSMESILDDLKVAAEYGRESFDYESLSRNLGSLLREFGISINSIADKLYISVSSLSRLLSGGYKMRDPEALADAAAAYVAENHSSDGGRRIRSLLSGETGLPPEHFGDIQDSLRKWLSGGYARSGADSANALLSRIDEFDLHEFYGSVDIRKVERIPQTKWKIPVTRKFTGTQGYKEGILEFLKATMTSSSREEIFIYSDYPIEDLKEDEEYFEKIALATGACILQGKKVRLIHNLNRPVHEIMMGLESWVPLYMTGGISSNYTDGSGSDLFYNTLFVSGAAVLKGQGIRGMEEESSYSFSKTTHNIADARRMAESLTSLSSELVRTFDSETRDEYDRIYREESELVGDRLIMAEVPSVSLMPRSLMDRMLSRYGIPDETKREVFAWMESRLKAQRRVLEHSGIREIIEDKDGHIADGELRVALEGRFGLPDIFYTDDEYREHLKSAEILSDELGFYSIEKRKRMPFRNITLTVRESGKALISKNKGSEFHFIMDHPLIAKALFSSGRSEDDD